MSADAISEEVFIREYTRELHNKNAAVFVGAGLSVGSGYVDWSTLLNEVIQDLGLDPKTEHDLVTLAQYHCNEAAGNKSKLTQAIFNHFAPTKAPTVNHRLLARLPVHTYWTTNYDKLLEKSLEEAKKVPDVKYTLNQLPTTRPDRDVVVYKMHGDIDHPADAVISKDDYESQTDKEKFVRTSMLRLQQQQMLLRSKLDRVYEDRLSDAIPEELWISKSAALQDELRQVRTEMERHEVAS